MTHRILALIATAPLVASIAHAGAPLIKLNDDGSSKIEFIGSATATYNDNIFFQKNKDSDIIYSVAPGLELSIGGDGNSRFTVSAVETFTTYSDFSDLNNNTANLNAMYSYDAGGPFKGRIGGSYVQQVQPTVLTARAGDIVESSTMSGYAIGDYRVTEKSTIETGARYNGIRYTSYEQFYNDQDSFSVPVTWLYGVTDKLNLGLTYQYTYTDLVKSGQNKNPLSGVFGDPGTQSINFIGATVRGQATEKLQLEADAGIGFLSIKDRAPVLGGERDQTTFNFSLTAVYTITEKLTSNISGGRSFSAGANAQGVTTTEGRVGFNYLITEAWSAGTYVGLSKQDYDTGGSDDIFNFGANVSYSINKYWRTTLAYSYMNDNTTRAKGDFDQNILSISASVRY